MRGRLHAGKLFAGRLFRAPAPVAVVKVPRFGDTGGQYRPWKQAPPKKPVNFDEDALLLVWLTK